MYTNLFLHDATFVPPRYMPDRALMRAYAWPCSDHGIPCSRFLCAHDLTHVRDRCIFTRMLPFAREHAVSTLTGSICCRLLSCVSSYGPCSLRCHSSSGVTRQAVSIVMPRSFTTLFGRRPALDSAVLDCMVGVLSDTDTRRQSYPGHILFVSLS